MIYCLALYSIKYCKDAWVAENMEIKMEVHIGIYHKSSPVCDIPPLLCSFPILIMKHHE